VLQLTDVLSLPILQNTLTDWAIACGVGVGLFLTLVALRAILRSYHRHTLATERFELLTIPAEVAGRTTTLFFAALALFVGLETLNVTLRTRAVVTGALTVIVFWQIGLWASAAIAAWIERRQRNAPGGQRALAGSLGVIAFIARAVCWLLVTLLMLDNLGVNITALVAGLGVGGVAVALAVQNILGDLFASLSITFDRPFVVGDLLTIDNYVGTVEHIGIKSTRLRSVSGEEIVISNADLLRSRVRNFGRMTERRVVFRVGVRYETPTDMLEQIPGLIRRIIEQQDGTSFDRCHFAAYGPAALEFETVYLVRSANYERYMDVQQQINLRVHREFERLGIEFAYPSQRLLIESGRRRGPAPQPAAERRLSVSAASVASSIAPAAPRSLPEPEC